jgi:hypothetical protein
VLTPQLRRVGPPLWLELLVAVLIFAFLALWASDDLAAWLRGEPPASALPHCPGANP